jgi:hypothetical protein
METFSIIHHKGRVNKATTLHGVVVERQEMLFVEEWAAFVPCAPYDEHFVYENPDKSVGASSYMCTCGSAAVVVNPERDGGRLFVCLFHQTYGSHTTSHVNRKDFESVAGETLDINPERAKWI